MKTTTKLLLALSLSLALFAGLATAPVDAFPLDPDDVCTCPAIYAPVLGADGVCYDNECYADCAGQEVVGQCGVFFP